MQRYKSVHTGAQIDSGVERALPGGELDASLSNKAEFDDGFLASGSIKSWAESKSIHTSKAANTFVTDLPYAGYWGVNFYFYPAGAWRVLIATDISDNKQYFITKNAGSPWSEWQQIATATPPTESDITLSGCAAPLAKISKDPFGFAHLQIHSLSFAANQSAWSAPQIGTLTAEYYPKRTFEKGVFDQNNNNLAVIVKENGAINLQVTGTPVSSGLPIFIDVIYPTV